MVLDFKQIELDKKVVFKRVKFKPPLKGVQIMESEACLLYNVYGPAQFYGGDQTQSVNTSESVLMKCGNYISDWRKIDDEMPYDVITIHFFPDVLEQVFENNIPEYLTKSSSKAGKIFQKVEKNDILKSYIDSLLIYFDNPDLFNNDTIKLKLKELIALLYNLDSNGIREILSDLFNPHKVEFKKTIEEHVFHDLSLEEFATLVHMSVSTFKRKFKETYDTSPIKYVISKKLEKAANLLSTTEHRVSDICFDCGFGDVSNFSKTFSKKYGVTPSEYQNKHKN